MSHFFFFDLLVKYKQKNFIELTPDLFSLVPSTPFPQIRTKNESSFVRRKIEESIFTTLISRLDTMGLDQLQMAPLVPEDSLLRLFTTQGKVYVMQPETFVMRDK